MNVFESRLLAGLGESPAEKTIYLAAVSGGADSTAMLAGLAELRAEAGFILHCVHVEHGLRPAGESRGDAFAVARLCKKLKVPCRIISFPPGRIASFAAKGGPGIEGAARFFRHKALNREARRIGADKILTAHTRDDLLETLLMRVLRGAGPAGLAPMPRSRGRFVRPLLDISRRDVLAYLDEKALPYRTDSTNADIKYLRNRVRLKLIPFLDEFFPFWRNSIPALAETQALTAEFLAAEARRRLPWEAAEDGKLRLHETDFFLAPPILREEAVFAAADTLAAKTPAGAEGKGRKIPPVPRRAAVRRAVKRETASPEDLGPVRLLRRKGFLEMFPAAGPPGESGFSLLIKGAGFYTLKGNLSGGGKGRDLYIRAETPPAGEKLPSGAFGFSAGEFRAKFPLVLRKYRGRDCLFRAGHKRRLSAILDRDARSGYTGVITAEDSDGPAAFICVRPDGGVFVAARDNAGAGADFSLFEVSPEAGFRETGFTTDTFL